MLKDRFNGDKKFIWMIPVFIIIPLLSAWVMASVFNMMTTAKYLAAFHGLFLVLLAFIICRVLETKRAAGIIMLAAILAVFSLRVPYAVSSEFDDKKAMEFLMANVRPDEGFVCIRLPHDGWKMNLVNLSETVKLNEKGADYVISSGRARDEALNKIKTYKVIWTYRVFGNDELFGANRLMDQMLEEAGFKNVYVNNLNGIEITKYEKKENG